MYAIVDFKGTQLKVQPEQVVKVAYLSDKKTGSEVEMNKVLMIRDDDKTEVGHPTVENAKVTAEVLEHKKDKKIIVFKKKRRKGYQKKQGHRQKFTELKIKEILGV
ncbi:MAG: 50S ribosomal protein L21 [Candidatus Cloacimonadota bacterium]|nr:50S ribosomal protein L21 [Candidatus Cloacimonadota bacterium]